MNLLTLAALCLVSGAFAAKQNLARKVESSGDITLTCSGGTEPYEFTKDTKTVTTSGTDVVVDPKGTVKIVKAKIKENVGSYQCKGKDGELSDSVDVGTAKTPKLTHVKDKLKYTFTCTSESVGATYSFFKDSKEMDSEATGITLNKEKLEINTAHYKNYIGKYTCKALLDLDAQVESNAVELSIEKPTLTISNDDKNVKLSCKTTTEGATYSMKKGSDDVKEDVAGGEFTTPVADVKAAQGAYTCKAKVGDKTSVDSDPQDFYYPLKPTLTKKDGADKTELKCATETTGTITYNFYKDDAAVTVNTDVTINKDKDTLGIATPKINDYAGKYQCEAVIGDYKIKSEVQQIGNSAPQLLTSGGLALCLCLLVSSFL